MMKQKLDVPEAAVRSQEKRRAEAKGKSEGQKWEDDDNDKTRKTDTCI